MKKYKFVSLLVLVALFVAACTPAAPAEPTAAVPVTGPTETPMPDPTATPEPTEAPQTIVDIAAADGRFNTLVSAVQAAGLVETLQSEGPFTVFAPTDDAFAALPEGALDGLLADPDALSQVLLYHVVPGQVMAADVVALESAETAAGLPVSIRTENDSVFINDSQVIITDIEASNGVIHVIDSVLLPPTEEASGEMPAPTADLVDTAAADGRFSTLLAAAEAAGLVETLKGEGPYTLFAPTDEAFAALPEGTVESLLQDPETLSQILLYHVVPGSVMAEDVASLTLADTAAGIPVKVNVDGRRVFINEAQVLQADIQTTNGIIHVIDSVILPPSDIPTTAAADGRFTTLLTAVETAGLVETLQSEGPFTVFAPTDDAFAKLPAGTVESLLQDPEALSQVLLYHVVPGRVMAADVVELESAATAQGQDVSIRVEDGQVYINDAQVIITDILTSNGVIHVIDSVILPPAE